MWTGGDAPRRAGGTTCRKHLSHARRSRRSEGSYVVLNMPRATARCIPCKVFWLTIRTLLPMKQIHAPPAPPTDAPPSAQERRGQQQQQRWRRRQHCQAAAPAAARQGAQSLAGAAGEAHASFPVRAADVLSGGAADVRPQRHAAEGPQPMGEGTGRNTESTVFPTDEPMYGLRRAIRTLQPLCGRRPHCRCIALSGCKPPHSLTVLSLMIMLRILRTQHELIVGVVRCVGPRRALAQGQGEVSRL
jgi:hypothetical protein